MPVGGHHHHSIRVAADGHTVEIIDQTRLPHEFVVRPLRSLDEAAAAVRDMWVRPADRRHRRLWRGHRPARRRLRRCAGPRLRGAHRHPTHRGESPLGARRHARPRNQGAQLTAWEMAGAGVPHALIVDNAGGHLMQHGLVDMVIAGTDRTTARGDVCNKIGTYLKALAAHDNGVPFYVALPSPTIDWRLRDGLAEIPIEERGADEVLFVQGRREDGSVGRVRIAPEATPARNPAFDVTPARLVSGLITERGICPASAEGLAGLFPDRAAA